MSARANGFAVVVAVLAIGAACNRPPGSEESASGGPAGMMDRASEGVNDTRITTTIQSRYFASGDVKGHDIDVDTAGGVVTLTGKVENENARQQALQIARGVEGVTRVDDQLVIMTDADRTAAARAKAPESRSPGWITTKIQAQYYVNPGLKPWNIDVTTSADGMVTLSGEIESASDRAEAVKIATNTEGVTRVEDRLHMKGDVAATTGSIERAGERAGEAVSDAWITTKIQSRYFVDDEVKGRSINVDTRDGVVTLKGSVNSHSERNQALAIARNTEGVRDVQDQLSVTPETRGTVGQTMNTAGQRIEDTWITTKIQSKYFASSEIKARKIDVDTRSGAVTINGAVGTSAAKELAVQLARETEGVTKVVDNLKVDPSLK